MKKIISLLLSVILILGSSNIVFAATDNETLAEPRASVRQQYSETPPLGSSGDYTVQVESYNGNKALDIAVAGVTTGVLVTVLAPLIGVPAIATSVAKDIIAGATTIGSSSKNLYYHVTVLGHKKDSFTYRKKVINYFTDSAHSQYVGTSVSYIYQYWW